MVDEPTQPDRIFLQPLDDGPAMCRQVQENLPGYWRNSNAFAFQSIALITAHLESCPVCQQEFLRVQEADGHVA